MAAVEPHSSRFVQDKNFYYFTGLAEPGAILALTGSGHETVFVPNYNGVRAQWVAHELVPGQYAAEQLGVDAVAYKGDVERGYSFTPFRRDAQYEHFFTFVTEQIGKDGVVHVIGQPGWQTERYAQQLSWFLAKFIPTLQEQQRLVDISYQVGELRRCKDAYEIAAIEKAIEVTCKAQKAAENAIVAGARECDAVAALEAVFMQHADQTPAFPSIVATGKMPPSYTTWMRNHRLKMVMQWSLILVRVLMDMQQILHEPILLVVDLVVVRQKFMTWYLRRSTI